MQKSLLFLTAHFRTFFWGKFKIPLSPILRSQKRTAKQLSFFGFSMEIYNWEILSAQFGSKIRHRF